jgi:radical SAM protein with 4Fe4S-binding SPASM domain
MSAHFTLHARLIKGCNADCSYCSSWEEDPSRMSPEDYRKSLLFIRDNILPQISGDWSKATLTIQYVGGEILLIPAKELRESVLAAREIFYPVFAEVVDGVQSNLVASERRVKELDLLFSGRIGTSVDGRGTQRTVKGSPDAYRKISTKSMEVIAKRRRKKPGAIFVVDNQGLGNLSFEMEEASRQGYSLVLRPVFQGGSDISSASISALVAGFSEAFDQWVMRSRVPVEPFTHLLSKRLFSEFAVGSVCPFQRNCADVSLDLEPDGTLYTCLDMADSGQVPFGNTLEGTLDHLAWSQLRARTSEVDPRCRSCPFFGACQGGCMSEALHHTGSIYGRSDLCAVWTALFKRIDGVAEAHGRDAVGQWLQGLGQ